MALSLEQYARYLGSRKLRWPAAPALVPPDLSPRLEEMPEVRAVTWSVYGTLVAIAGGGLSYRLEEGWRAELAMDRVVQEFRLWPAMTRKPVKPGEQLAGLYKTILERTHMERSGGSASGYPEMKVEAVWKTILSRLLRNGYQYDGSFYGPPVQYGQKIAYFFHRCLQGTGPYEGAYEVLRELKSRGLGMGIVADGQCFTPIQLHEALAGQGPLTALEDLFDSQSYSFQSRARKPADRVFRAVLRTFAQRDIRPDQVLHVGSDPKADVFGARQVGMRAALLVSNQETLDAIGTLPERGNRRPDVLLTDLRQIRQVLFP